MDLDKRQSFNLVVVLRCDRSYLPAGAIVEVIVLLETSEQLAAQGLSRFIGAAQGNFASPEEVDQFIRQERET